MALIPKPSDAWNDLVHSGLLRDGVAYGVGLVLVVVGLAMVAFGPAQVVVRTAAKVAT